LYWDHKRSCFYHKKNYREDGFKEVKQMLEVLKSYAEQALRKAVFSKESVFK
jgi:hypothetical protein